MHFLGDGIRDASNEIQTFQYVKVVKVEGSQVSSECLVCFCFHVSMVLLAIFSTCYLPDF